MDSTRLFYSNEQVANYNHEQLTKLKDPIAQIQACHSSPTAAKLPSEEMSGLKRIVFLAKGAKVMLPSICGLLSVSVMERLE